MPSAGYKKEVQLTDEQRKLNRDLDELEKKYFVGKTYQLSPFCTDNNDLRDMIVRAIRNYIDRHKKSEKKPEFYDVAVERNDEYKDAVQHNKVSHKNKKFMEQPIVKKIIQLSESDSDGDEEKQTSFKEFVKQKGKKYGYELKIEDTDDPIFQNKIKQSWERHYKKPYEEAIKEEKEFQDQKDFVGNYVRAVDAIHAKDKEEENDVKDQIGRDEEAAQQLANEGNQPPRNQDQDDPPPDDKKQQPTENADPDPMRKLNYKLKTAVQQFATYKASTQLFPIARVNPHRLLSADEQFRKYQQSLF